MDTPLLSRHLVPNKGSNARDFCMLERNFLTHIKLAILLALLSSSILLRARLVPEDEEEPEPEGDATWPVALIQILAALAAIASGYWEYRTGCIDLERTRAFLRFYAVKPPLMIMTFVVLVVVSTCLLFLTDRTFSA